MRICRFDDDRIGIVRDDLVYDVTPLLPLVDGADGSDRVMQALPALLALRDAAIAGCTSAPVDGVRLLAPVSAPSKSYVAGYCLGLDITLRGSEERSLRKSLDSYTVLGPWLVTADEVADPMAITLRLSVDTELRQDCSTRDLIADVAALVAYASRFYTLLPGGLIYTGTPAGVGPIGPGVVLHASGTGLGSMDVAVRAAL